MRKVLLYVCLLAVLCTALAGCDTSFNGTIEVKTDPVNKEETNEKNENKTEETDKSEEYIAMYDIVLEDLYELIGSSETDHLPSYMINILEDTDEDPYEFFGYSYRDLNGDDIPELLITAEDSSTLYAVYTIKKDKVTLVDEFSMPGTTYWCNLLEDGKIYYFQGGNWRCTGVESLSKDGELVCEEKFFIEPDPKEVCVYYNTTGSDDPEESEKVTWEDMEAFSAECESKFATVESTPLGEIK